MNNKAITTQADFQPIINLVINSLDSSHSRDAYERALQGFLSWWMENGKPPIVKATIQEYKSHLAGLGYSPSTINQKMSAIRKLATEAADNGLMDQQIANGIGKVKGVKSAGVRTGNWLTKDQAERLINSPDTSTLKGLRDRAILAVLIGTGIRRSELAALTFEDIQQRDGRWVIVDLIGKRNRVRSVPMPSWAKAAIDYWAEAAGIDSGHVFRGFVYGRGRAQYVLDDSEGITPQVVYNVVKEYIQEQDLDIAPHDLRRSFSKLALKGGAKLDQIQLTLGHASIRTTELYLGVEQNLTDAPCDVLGLDISGD